MTGSDGADKASVIPLFVPRAGSSVEGSRIGSFTEDAFVGRSGDIQPSFVTRILGKSWRPWEVVALGRPMWPVAWLEVGIRGIAS